MSLEKVNEHLY